MFAHAGFEQGVNVVLMLSHSLATLHLLSLGLLINQSRAIRPAVLKQEETWYDLMCNLGDRSVSTRVL
jgi:hypothetical protein